MAILLTLAVLGIATVSHGAPSVFASLDARRFSVDQAATLTITVNDVDGTIGEIASMMQSYAWLRSKGMMLEDIKNQMKNDESDTDTAKE